MLLSVPVRFCPSDNRRNDRRNSQSVRSGIAPLLSMLQLVLKLIHRTAHILIDIAAVGNDLRRMKHVGMSSAESRTDLVTGKTGQFATEIHGDHTRFGDLTGSP